MSEEPDNQELEHRIELLKKDYRIMELNIDGTLKTMRTDIDKTLHKMRDEAAKRDEAAVKRDVEAAKPETSLILVTLVAVGTGVGVLAFILS